MKTDFFIKITPQKLQIYSILPTGPWFTDNINGVLSFPQIPISAIVSPIGMPSPIVAELKSQVILA